MEKIQYYNMSEGIEKWKSTWKNTWRNVRKKKNTVLSVKFMVFYTVNYVK